MVKGLSNAEAKQQLERNGYNELPTTRTKNILQLAIEVVKEPMFILLLICASLYIILGDYTEGIILMNWVFVMIFITFYQHRKTEKALEELRKLSSPRALVIRDGQEIRIPSREVVPEDVLIVNEGDRVPADGIILEATSLSIDESILTGESVPVLKGASNDVHDRVYSSTLVVRGRGFIKITETGIHTEFGKIGKSLESIEVGVTNLQKEMKVLIRNLFIIGLVLSTIVILGFYFTRGNFVESLLSGLAAAMAILPEEFPVVLTVFLALGAWRLSQKNVLTRKPTAIETLGSATVLCSDKTGTITQNKMQVASLSYDNALVHKSSFDTNKKEITNMLSLAFLASQKDSIDPMEKAIGNAYFDVSKQDELKHELVREYPLEITLFAMTRVVKLENGEMIVACKGSPESVLDLCKIENSERSELMSRVHSMAEKGQRVLGLAKASWDNNSLPDKQDGFDFHFVGFIGLEDPIRPEVPSAIKECYQAGIKVIMITGDYPLTAKSIAQQAGIEIHDSIITGDELEKMSNDELKTRINTVTVFARIVPAQKLKIIQALKANGEVVAMTGDGVNDAPALKAADIGIAMGGKGTDVARESSSLVLLDDNFSSIVAAIRLGRKIFDNLQKAMAYIIAIHIPIIGLTLVPAFFPELPILLMPLHIVFMEMIIDPVCSIAFESEKEEYGIMDRPPRKITEQFFGFKKIMSSASMGLLLLAMVITVYFLSINEGHNAGEIRAITFSALIIGNMFLILTTLSKTRSAISVLFEKNIALLVILFAASGLLFMLISVPYLRGVFSFDFVHFNHFIISILGAFLVLILLETLKYYKNGMRRKSK